MILPYFHYILACERNTTDDLTGLRGMCLMLYVVLSLTACAAAAPAAAAAAAAAAPTPPCHLIYNFQL